MAVDGGVARSSSSSSTSRRNSYAFTELNFLERRKTRISNLRNFSLNGKYQYFSSYPRCRSLCGNHRILSMDAREKSRSRILESSKHKRVPVFVMMPADILNIDSTGSPKIRRIRALTVSLKALKLAGVHGIAVEVWWGIVERFSPCEYNWCVYEELFRLVSASGLKLHVALCFHSNTSLSTRTGVVSLPLWTQEIGDHNRDIYYRDKNGFSGDDCLTLGVDNLPVFYGPDCTPMLRRFHSQFC